MASTTSGRLQNSFCPILWRSVLTAFVSVLCLTKLFSSSYYLTWDPQGNPVWNSSSLNWSNGTLPPQSWSDSLGNDSSAIFSGTGGHVTMQGSIMADQIIFDTGGYTLDILNSGSLTIYGAYESSSQGMISVAAGQRATINGSIATSHNNFLVTGGGELVFTGSNSTVSGLWVQRGTARLMTANSSLVAGSNLGLGVGLMAYSGANVGGRGTFIADDTGATHNTAQNAGYIFLGSGDSTVASERHTSFNASLNFTDLSSGYGYAAGTLNFVVNGGINGQQNKITFSNLSSGAGFMGSSQYFNGSNFAWYDSSGFVRGINYGVDAGSRSTGSTVTVSSTDHLQIAGLVSGQTDASFQTIKLTSAGNLAIRAGNTVGVSGILKTGSNSSLISGGSITSSSQDPSASFLTVRTDQASDLLTISSEITDGANATFLIKSGAGKLILTGTNTYSGATFVNGGILSVGSISNFSVPGGLGSVAENFNTSIFLSTGTLQFTGANGATNRTFEILPGGGGVDVTSGTLSLNGAIKTSYFVENNDLYDTYSGLIKSGTGTLILAGDSFYPFNLEVDGGTVLLNKGNGCVSNLTINQGVVRLAGDTEGNQISDHGLVSVNQGGVLDLNGNNETIYALRGNGLITTSSATTSTLTLDIGSYGHDENQIYDFGGSISDGKGVVALSIGSGNQIFSGSSSYSGGTRIGSIFAYDPYVVIANNQALGSGDVTVSSGTLTVRKGISLANSVKLAGGNYNHEIAAGSTYAGAVDATSGVGGSKGPTTARLLDGMASHDTTVQSSFAAYFYQATNDAIRQSDVYSLAGTGTDVFVLELSFSSIGINSYLAYLDNTSKWANAVAGNTGGSSVIVLGAYNPTADFHLGYYGIDLANQSVWAVLNYSSTFSVVAQGSGTTTVISGTQVYPNGLMVNSGTLIIATDGVVSTGTSNTVVSQGSADRGALVVSGSLSNVSAYIGSSSGALGMATVSGSNAVWTSTSSLVVGSGGAGLLQVQNGGAAIAGQVVVGDQAGSSGDVLVSGSGSYLESNAADLVVGNQGLGNLNITAGGQAAAYGTTIASGTGSSGSVSVSGSGSQLLSIDYTVVGLSGTGSLNIQGGGNVTTGQLVAGQNAGSAGSVTVGGAGSVLVNTSTDYAMIIGLDGTGTLTVQGGGQVFNHNALLGTDAGSYGYAKVTGAGSLWSSSGTLVVGASGSSTLVVEAAGQLADSSAYLGFGAGSLGSAKVTGLGSTWTTDNLLVVGNAGQGTLSVENSAQVSDYSAALAYYAGSVGTATVSGSGSLWTNSNAFSVGLGGTGTLSILSGGIVSDNEGTAGYFAGSKGTVNVQGAGSQWNSSGNLGIGFGGQGTLNILAGGVASGSFAVLGNLAGSYGTATVDGSGSQLNALGTLMVGNSGTGALTLQAAGTASSAFGVIAASDGSQGTVTVTGGGSQWSIQQGLFVGEHGVGALNVLAAGKVASAEGAIGNFGSGTVLVDGVGSQWITSADVKIASSGTGLLALTNGGVATVNGGTGTVTLAELAGSQGTLQIGQGASAGALNASRVVGGLGQAVLGFNFSGTTLSFGAQLSGNLNVVKDGYGTTVLTGSNSQTGEVRVNSGTLRVGNIAALGSATNSVAMDGGTLDLAGKSLAIGALSGSSGLVTSGTSGALKLTINQNSDTGYAGSLLNGSGVLGFIKTGTGTLALTGSNNYSGGTSILGGFLQIDNNTRLGTGTLALDGGGIRFGAAFTNLRGFTTGTTGATLDTNGFTSGVAQAITGAGSLTKIGSGSLTLSAANTYTGGTFLNGGTLIVGNASALGSTSGTTTFQGGILDLNGFALSLGAVQGFSGTITNNKSSAGTLTSSLSGTSQFGGIISNGLGVLNLVKTGTGTWILFGNNTYTGATTINSGVLQLGNGGTTGSLGGGVISNNATLGVNRSDSLTLAQVINGSGKLVKDGTGTLILNGANGYTGGTVLNGGSLILGNAKALGATSGDLTINGGQFDLSGFSGTIGLLSGTGGTIFNSVDATTSKLSSISAKSGIFAGSLADQAPGFSVMSGTIPMVGSKLTLEKGGTGTLTLSGSNSYSGGTILSGGGLNLASANAIGTGTLTISGVTTLDNTSGSSLTLATNNAQNWNANFTFKGSGALDLGTGNTVMNASRTVTVTSNTLTIGGAISGTSATFGLTKSGTGTLVLANDNTYAGATTISQGVLQLGNGGTTGSIAGALINNATFALNRSDDLTFSKLISGSGRFIKNGMGVLVLSGSNTYTGGTVLSDGTLVLGTAKALGAATGDLTVNGGQLDLNGFSPTVGLLSGTGGTIFNSVGGTTAKLTTISTKSGTFTGSLADQAPGISPMVSSKLAFEKGGTGTLTLSGSNSYSGGTLLSAGGLNVANAYALGSGTVTISGAITLDNSSGAPLALAGNNDQSWNSNFTFKGSNDLDLGTGNVTMNATRTVTVANHSLTVGGMISGTSASIGLMKSGTGTLILAGDNTYTGVTTVSQGILQLGNGGTTGSVAGALVNNATLDINHSDSFSLSKAITGSGKFIKDGVGTLTLSGTNTYSGGTVLNSGGLILGNSKALGAVTGDLTINGGYLDLHGYNTTVGLLSGSGGAIFSTSGTTVKLTINTTKSGTFAGNLLDAASPLALEKAGTGTLTLSGNNAYGGGTVLSGGGLNIASVTALGSGTLTISGAIILDNSSGASLALASNNDQNWNSNFSFRGSNDLDLGTGNVLMNASRTVTVTAKTLTVGGAISGSSTSVGLTKSGTGTLVLASDNTYTGVTTVSQGTLQLGNGGTTGSIAGNLVNNATLALNRSDDLAFAKLISGSGKFVKNGSNNVTLSGTNTYTGGTVLNSGVLTLGNAKALGAASGDLTINGGALDLRGNTVTTGLLSGLGGQITNGAVNTTAKLVSNSAKSGVFAGSIMDLSGTYTVADGLSTSSISSFSVSSDTVTQSLSTKDSGIVVVIGGSSGTLINNTYLNAVAFEKAGTGALTLSGSSNYSGGTTLTAGTLNLANAYAIGTGTLTIGNGTTLDNTSGGALTLLSGNAQTWNGNFTFKGSSSLDMGGGVVSINAARTVTVTSNTLTVGVVNGSTSTSALTKAGAGTLVLAGGINYQGTTTISAGTLQLGNGGDYISVGTGAIVNNATLAVDVAVRTEIANVSGRGAVIQNGDGLVVYTGNNTYTGGTVINAGTADAANSTALGHGNVTLKGGTLFTENYGQAISISGNLLWDSDARITLSLATVVGANTVNVGGSLTKLDSTGGKLTFNLDRLDFSPGQQFTLLTVAKGFGALTVEDFDFVSSNPDFDGSLSIVGHSLIFTVNSALVTSSVDLHSLSTMSAGVEAVPEPSIWAMLALGGLALGVALSRRSARRG